MTTTSAAEREEFRAVLRQVLDKRSSEADVRRVMESETGVDRELWVTMADELGLQGLSIPVGLGGAGAGWDELAVVFEELGRSLACTPFLATVGLAVPVLLASDDGAAQDRWLPSIADGTTIATAALLGKSRDSAADVAVVVDSDGTSRRLTGTETHVLDASVADVIFLLARDGEEIGVYAVESNAPGLVVTGQRTSDLTRRFATISLDSVPATLVGSADAGLTIAAHARLAATAALACEQAGGAAAVLDAAVEYAKTRHQFGRAIGSFQAVKHLCANMLVSVEAARSASWALLRALDENSADLPLVAAAARVVCSESYATSASTNIQVHGGIGFTWEHGAHLHLKRSRGSAVLLGTPKDNRERLAALAPVFAEKEGTGS